MPIKHKPKITREVQEMVKGPHVKFKLRTGVKSGYIISENENEVVVWYGGRPKKIKQDQIVFRQK